MQVRAQRFLAHLRLGKPETQRRRFGHGRRELAADRRGASQGNRREQRKPVRQRLDGLDEIREADDALRGRRLVPYRVALGRPHAEAVPVVENLHAARRRAHEKELDDAAARHLRRIDLGGREEHVGMPAERREDLFARQLEAAVPLLRRRLRRRQRPAGAFFGVARGVERARAVVGGHALDLLGPRPAVRGRCGIRPDGIHARQSDRHRGEQRRRWRGGGDHFDRVDGVEQRASGTACRNRKRRADHAGADEIGDVVRRIAFGVGGVAVRETGRKLANGLRESANHG